MFSSYVFNGEFVFFLTVDKGQKFSSTPSLASLPDPPTKPLVSQVTDTSVHLSWAPGTQVGASSVFAFQVEYFGYKTTEVSWCFQKSLVTLWLSVSELSDPGSKPQWHWAVSLGKMQVRTLSSGYI